jgi:PleD family two-component response regulator
MVAGEETLDAVLQRADDALYRAKNDGRNQVQMAIVAP